MKAFRNELTNHSEAEQLKFVAEYWSRAPISTMAYDPEKLNELPTPWEMMCNNDWCRNSLAIGMEFTLRLIGWAPERMTIRYIKDYDISDQTLILEIDEKTWLNYDYGMAVNKPNTKHVMLESWRFTGKFYKIIIE